MNIPKPTHQAPEYCLTLRDFPVEYTQYPIHTTITHVNIIEKYRAETTITFHPKNGQSTQIKSWHNTCYLQLRNHDQTIAYVPYPAYTTYVTNEQLHTP